jgi:CRISPR-associated protein Csm4
MMKLFKAHIEPIAPFATLLKGDTLFGQLCWAIAHMYGETELVQLLEGYTQQKPFLVVSDPMAPGYLPKPTMPFTLLGEDPEKKKINRKKVWIECDALQKGAYDKAVTSEEAKFELRSALSVHNAINYKTGTTGEGFDPFALEMLYYAPFELYMLVDENRWSADKCQKALVYVGMSGYGKKATTGKGRFEVISFEEAVVPTEGRDFMALAPLVLENCDAQEVYYDTFVRFGKHGSHDAKPNPFKKPILMAQTGAVLRFEMQKPRFFAGKGIGGISVRRSETVHQGYAPLIAIGVR